MEGDLMSKLIRRFEFEDREYLLVGSIHAKKESRIIIEKMARSFEPESCVLELPPEEYSKPQPQNGLVDKFFEWTREFVWVTGEATEMLWAEENLPLIVPRIKTIRADRDPVLTHRRLFHAGGAILAIRLALNSMAYYRTRQPVREPLEEILEQVPFEECVDYADAVKKEYFAGSEWQHRIMLTERDLLFADALRRAPGKKIMAVVGAAHLHGIPYFMETTKPNDPIFPLLLTRSDGIAESGSYLQKYMESVGSS
eukprot:TRINITY_DN4672_c0_g1_i1.p1 TRINITY_DN4672_c0_g1~~TRINITY_DN4672_c0_g1_i1.p1  ORF type:complete len:289 (-),score=36.13 TRINITY_DN4672_c0_g1_i1:259-1023(-)